MDPGVVSNPRKTGKYRKAAKDLGSSGRGRREVGRSSPESVSLYGDYDTSRQYEDKVGRRTIWGKNFHPLLS